MKSYIFREALHKGVYNYIIRSIFSHSKTLTCILVDLADVAMVNLISQFQGG